MQIVVYDYRFFGWMYVFDTGIQRYVKLYHTMNMHMCISAIKLPIIVVTHFVVSSFHENRLPVVQGDVVPYIDAFRVGRKVCGSLWTKS